MQELLLEQERREPQERRDLQALKEHRE